jgi:hypothetical protein
LRASEGDTIFVRCGKERQFQRCYTLNPRAVNRRISVTLLNDLAADLGRAVPALQPDPQPGKPGPHVGAVLRAHQRRRPDAAPGFPKNCLVDPIGQRHLGGQVLPWNLGRNQGIELVSLR